MFSQATESDSYSLAQGASSVDGQDAGGPQAQPDPIKVPQEPMVRDITAGLSIPEEVDELMREHIRFLYREGNALRSQAPRPKSAGWQRFVEVWSCAELFA